MAMSHKIWEQCVRCEGTGQIVVRQPYSENPVEPTYFECPSCNGEGKLLWGHLEKL